MKTAFWLSVFLMLGTLNAQSLWNGQGHIPQQYQLNWTNAGLLPDTPIFADYLFDVTEFGADPGDNGNDDYPAIQAAVLQARDSSGLSITLNLQ